eukprot:TRINITY_DN13709_c0_g1_i1.p1 TRINITY_DN13709_c0_g1~~TRINITY_DN13709_c0_g1_i1.p1  ORF type:complete len:273 (-),score=39.84 TRINITY_DN13709_c0_g1_i1:342-1160(-)
MLPMLPLVAPCLRSVDLAYLQSVDMTTKAIIAEADVWSTIVKREMPNFVVDENLVKNRALQHLIVSCFGFLSRAIMSAQCVVRVSSVSDLQVLDAKLRSAARARTAHIRGGGRAACVLVGDFLLARDSPSPRFPLEQIQSLPLCGFYAGELQLKVCIEDGKVMVGAKYREFDRLGRLGASQSNHVFTVDISSVNSATALSLRGARLSADGSLNIMPIGSCSYALGRRSVDPRKVSSLCVVTLMDGDPQDATSQLANALSMELPSNRRPHALI